MAATDDKASITLSASLLPVEIRKTLTSLTTEYTPTDNAEAWYSKITNIPNTTNGVDLLSEIMLVTNSTGGGSGTYGTLRGTASTATTTTVDIDADKVKFLFVQHLSITSDGSSTNTADSIYLVLDGGNVAHTTTDAIEIGPGEAWYCKPGCLAEDIHVICAQKARAGTSSSTIQCYVAAIIEDVA
jgi:hypothetical protein